MHIVGEVQELTCPRRGHCRSGIAGEAPSCYSASASVRTYISSRPYFLHHSQNQAHDSKENNITSHTLVRVVSRSVSTETPTAVLCGQKYQAGVPVQFSIYYQECSSEILDKRLRTIQTPCCITIMNSLQVPS